MADKTKRKSRKDIKNKKEKKTQPWKKTRPKVQLGPFLKNTHITTLNINVFNY